MRARTSVTIGEPDSIEPYFEPGPGLSGLRQRAEGVVSPSARVASPPVQTASPQRLSATSGFIAVVVCVALSWGYIERDSWGVTPGRGLGYWIGIVGALLILATLAYPLRKYWRVLARLGAVAGWFQVHMLLGIFGPALIMFHANFRLGALNSNVALVTMLCVAGSGVIGRYLYGKIHHGLHGRRAELSEMVSSAADMRRTLGGDLPQNSPMWLELEQLEAMARRPSRGLLGALAQSFLLSSRSSIVRSRVARDVRRFIDGECRQSGLPRARRRTWLRAANEHLKAYFETVNGTAQFIVFERLFALWHVLHVPIFVVMALSVIVHIIAVHFY